MNDILVVARTNTFKHKNKKNGLNTIFRFSLLFCAIVTLILIFAHFQPEKTASSPFADDLKSL